MLTTNAFASIGALVGDPARASMLMSLMDGRALTATELAGCAGVTPQTASSHLSQLVDAGLIAMERQGRHRYHRLANPTIAQMVEGMMAVAAIAPAHSRTPVRTGPRDLALRQVRTCYDHLAGRVAVAMTDAMVARRQIEFSEDGGELTAAGSDFLWKLGIETGAKATKRHRVLCKPCLDWSERRLHLAGTVGATICHRFIETGWIRRVPGSRAIDLTPTGRNQLQRAFGLSDELWTMD